MKNAFALSALALLLSLGAANAQTITAAPNTMNFQGRLAKKDGTPVPDGVHTVTFRIYDAQTSGNVKWAEQIGSLNTKNGAFSAVLGKIFPFNDVILNSAIWLEIQLDSDPALTPRQQFQSVAYALKANTVPDGAITTAKIADGAITTVKLAPGVGGGPSGWLLSGNSGITSGFLGTTDASPLDFRVNNHRALRYAYAENTTAGFRSVNILGGSELNSIDAGVVGATIAGGGYDDFVNSDSPNRIGADFGTISGGYSHTVLGSRSTIGGGQFNTANGYIATIGGGIANVANGGSSTVAGGERNQATVYSSTVGGGYHNIANGSRSTIAGGDSNSASDYATTVGGGANNIASAYASTVAGGYTNTASGPQSVVAGGYTNSAIGFNAVVPGGINNVATGDASFAGGTQAKARHQGAFVWADSVQADFASTNTNQFLIRAANGVGINTNNPGAYALFVSGAAKITGNLVVNTTTYPSDARYKTNIETLNNPLENVLNLRGVSYDWDRTKWPGNNFGEGKQIGFIAQELEEILPDLVQTDKDGYKSVNYIGVVPVLVEAIKAQEKKIDALQKQSAEIAELKAQIAALTASLREVKAAQTKTKTAAK